MVSRSGGIVRRMPGDAIIRQLPTFHSITWDVKPGDYIAKTIDCFTRPGCVQLIGNTEEEVERDFEAIHDLEELGMIDYSVICPTPPSIGAVVVVDPFSSGANIAAMVLMWGYKLILVFSEQDSPVAKLVTKGSKVEPTLLVQHDNSHPNQNLAIQQTLAAITGQGSPILAIIPGAETGVELADKLASNYGTRCNGAAMTDVRRNKYKMQDALRKEGKVRAVKQEICRTEQEVSRLILCFSILLKVFTFLFVFLSLLLLIQVRTFIQHLSASHNNVVKCVVKPNQSAGSDSVFLCNSIEDAVSAFHSIHGQINGLGQINDGALCQEYLNGTEYAVDGVSRDGVYKVIAIWEYDKRSVNGANFVYFGMRLVDTTSPKVRSIVDYAKAVVSGLKIVQGPSHMEIICEETSAGQYSPCLVEVGTRCHGGEGTWLPVALECIGKKKYLKRFIRLHC